MPIVIITWYLNCFYHKFLYELVVQALRSKTKREEFSLFLSPVPLPFAITLILFNARIDFSTKIREIFIIILSFVLSTKQRYFYRLLLAPNPAVQRNMNHTALRCNALHCNALYYILYRVYRKSRTCSLTTDRTEKIGMNFRQNQRMRYIWGKIKK